MLFQPLRQIRKVLADTGCQTVIVMAKEQKKTKGSKPRYMTTYEAAELLGLSAGTLRVWRCQGKGPSYYKVGNAVRYKVDDLEAWKSANVRRVELMD